MLTPTQPSPPALVAGQASLNFTTMHLRTSLSRILSLTTLVLPVLAQAPSSPSSAPKVVQIVRVSDDTGTLKYFPEQITADPGTFVMFEFYPKVSLDFLCFPFPVQSDPSSRTTQSPNHCSQTPVNLCPPPTPRPSAPVSAPAFIPLPPTSRLAALVPLSSSKSTTPSQSGSTVRSRATVPKEWLWSSIKRQGRQTRH